MKWNCREYVAVLYMTPVHLSWLRDYLRELDNFEKKKSLIPYSCDVSSLDIISSVFSLKHLRCSPCAKVVYQISQGSDCFGCLNPRVCPLKRPRVRAVSAPDFGSRGRVRIPLWARFFPILNGALLHRAFQVRPSIVSKWLKYCWTLTHPSIHSGGKHW